MAKKAPDWMPSSDPILYDYNGQWDKRWRIVYQVWDTDQKKFVQKRTWIPSVMPFTERKKLAKKVLNQIKEQIKDGFMAGDAPYKEEKFDLEKLTIKKALNYFLNYKNATTTTGDPFVWQYRLRLRS